MFCSDPTRNFSKGLLYDVLNVISWLDSVNLHKFKVTIVHGYFIYFRLIFPMKNIIIIRMNITLQHGFTVVNQLTHTYIQISTISQILAYFEFNSFAKLYRDR